MIANKVVDDSQLQAEAAALGGTHVGHFITSTGTNPTKNVLCDAGNGTGVIALCATGQTALTAHTATTNAALAAGANNGGSPPAPSFIAGVGSSSQRGALQFGSGTGPSAGAQVAVTFKQAYPSAPAVFLEPLNSATVALGLYISSLTATGCVISSANAPAASQAGTVYKVMYLVVA